MDIKKISFIVFSLVVLCSSLAFCMRRKGKEKLERERYIKQIMRNVEETEELRARELYVQQIVRNREEAEAAAEKERYVQQIIRNVEEIREAVKQWHKTFETTIKNEATMRSVAALNKNLRERLNAIELPKEFVAKNWGGSYPNFHWMQFDRKEKYVKKPEFKKENSSFSSPWPRHIGDWAKYHKKIWGEKSRDVAQSIMFVDVDRGIYPYNGPFSLDNKKLNDYLKTKNARKMQQEVIKGKAYRFKIHFQIKPKYLPRFVRKFLGLLTTDNRLNYIKTFKVAYTITPGSNYWVDSKNKKGPPEDAFPMVAVYVPLIPFDNLYILENIIKAVEQKFNEYLFTGELKIPPRFNKRIKGFIYLAGGDGDDKRVYKAAIERGLLPRNLIYNNDNYEFFRGYVPRFVRYRR